MKKLSIIRHVDYERLGWLPELLDELAIPYESISLSHGDDFPLVAELSGVISMGGPMSAYNLEEFPFLEEEMAFDRKVVKNGIPLLGICLGAQILAQAFAAEVHRDELEIGWIPLKKTSECADDPVFGQLEVPPCFQLHYDVLDLPKDAVALLSSPSCSYQAFRLVENVYGIQFHPETNMEMLKSVIDEYQIKISEDQLQLMQDRAQEHSLAARAFFKKILQRLFSSV